MQVNSKKRSSSKNESFHSAFGPCLVISQFFGILSVKGAMGKDENCLQFQWFSLRTIYALTFLFFASIDAGTGIRRFFRLGFNIKFAESLLFFLTGMAKASIFLRIATHWREIMLKWHEYEKPFLHSPYEGMKSWKLKTKVRLIFSIIVIVSLGLYIYIKLQEF